MVIDTSYISPEFNPHSLQRDWGLFVLGDRPSMIEVIHASLSELRFGLCQYIGNDWQPITLRSNENIGVTAKVITDGITGDTRQLYHEVGLDVLTLALLADVPLHRPTRIDHNSLVGHWRWLRAVWRSTSSRQATQENQCITPEADPGLRELVACGKNNLAIAALREGFSDLENRAASTAAYHSFLANLTLFCPFIGTELLWRQGLITASKNEGMME